MSKGRTAAKRGTIPSILDRFAGLDLIQDADDLCLRESRLAHRNSFSAGILTGGTKLCAALLAGMITRRPGLNWRELRPRQSPCVPRLRPCSVRSSASPAVRTPSGTHSAFVQVRRIRTAGLSTFMGSHPTADALPFVAACTCAARCARGLRYRLTPNRSAGDRT